MAGSTAFIPFWLVLQRGSLCALNPVVGRRVFGTSPVRGNKKDVDVKDCYFDKECHKLVDWKKIGAVKEGIIARFRTSQKDEAEMSMVMETAREQFKEAGMPEDRIYYILEKWAKYAGQTPDINPYAVDVKDCYFDKECHKLVDWNKIGAVKERIITRFRIFHNDEAEMSMVMKTAHEQFKEAGMPEDRIDYILKKWAKYAEPKPDIKPDAEG